MQTNMPIWYGASTRRPRVAFSARKPATSARASPASDRGTDRHSRGPMRLECHIGVLLPTRAPMRQAAPWPRSTPAGTSLRGAARWTRIRIVGRPLGQLAGHQMGRVHVGTQVTNAQFVVRLLLEKKNQ